MLNLSDKELDRFSQEAAQEYEPGEALGPRSWDRLEVRMNQEFGSPGWNPIQHIRRWPFFYAPVLLVLLGVTYYLVRGGHSSGSSPGETAKAPASATASGSTSTSASAPTSKTPDQNQNSVSTDKATSTSPSSTNPTGTSSSKEGAAAAPVGSDHAAGSDGNADVRASAGSKASASSSNAAGGNSAASGNHAAGTDHASGADDAAVTDHTAGGGAKAAGANAVREGSAAAGGRRVEATGNMVAGGKVVSGGNAGRGRRGVPGSVGGVVGSTVGTGNNVGTGNKAGTAGDGMNPAAKTNVAAQNREVSLVAVQRPRSLSKRSAINDSALRAFNAKSLMPSPIKKKGVYRIDRKWQFGLMVAPDFTSVNSLAGDKAGSSIGLTVDYNFASHWYISTGILSTRKNYAARNQDYHAPHDFYMQNGINSAGVNFVKGSFYMMEIPLNLRYDFLTSGNTLFFASAGTSSYLMTTENANFYWRHFNQDECNPVDHVKVRPTSLFACLNFSAGVETGLTNSMSLVIAPYMKLPTKNLGIGQVQMNSVGINFVLKWSPISARKRD